MFGIDLHAAALVAVIAAVTMLLRFLPFFIFGGGRPTPRYVLYLARVLPCAIMAMLVVYCLRGADPLGPTHALPELLAGAAVVGSASGAVGAAVLPSWLSVPESPR